ncbi:ABC transporter permease [Kineococcus aurantiacus]|uniref:Peptide/nickel transport system permease protein n=1 Tax=Kineococcus aurantiacus TaxID=37633 RepID=A0A7Y9ARS3_9ACTN|nr:peptide/nickel transport system permease protein [Kineococcus aurantiacus]
MTALDAPVVEATGADGVGPWHAAWRRLRRNPAGIVGAVLVLLFVLVALAAPLLAPYRPATSEWFGEVTPTTVPGPSADHPLGLDSFGSDLLTQLLYGARSSLVIGVVSTAVGLAAGAVLGVLAGGLGGKVDTVVMRVVDVLLSIPALLLAVSVAAVLDRGALAIMLAVAAAQVPIFARLLRASLLAQRGQDYVVALRSLGLRQRRIVVGHMLPNSLGPVLVQATLTLATAVIEVAALSFLGLGDPNPAVAEWGRMLVTAQARLDQAPQLALYPGLAIALTALGFTLLGEALREALDPRSSR